MKMTTAGMEGGGEQQRGFIEECKQLGFTTACQQQWQRSVAHATAYPYVWASYAVTFGGLGIYGTWRWRQLRKVENEVLQIQRELLKSMQQEEIAASQVTKPQATGSLSQQLPLESSEVPDLSKPEVQAAAQPPLKA